ncbi:MULTISPECIES: S8 family serine peptidase [Streptomyces]|uniref:S8 family serine peptidase n=1 Tax=Streptomyces caniscabiei TaxID=2746961 RepID=A0ABU4MS79_9ACTN|nr:MULTISPECIES: S8 family serine peptidase [Streptomyces]MBE4739385.1 S8 family serine peptidase [Streptomyces caniscabiei]MBE4760542.1 S8 family serine peptidase [Streptomyces caniscabiei]MBE4772752.1 S8 family serine peptidase [Streptomyces caniscabiei]MBE4784681.1 S8 family serine peptidase [Streptomyces caniscabiei]MBE4798644.1 S8 family serine peptidase [Streptomyces caniscabiei]
MLMTLTPHPGSGPGARRVARIAVAAGLVAALSAAGPIPLAFSADDPSAAVPSDGGVKSAHDKLGSTDADLLAEAKADGDKNVTMMIATTPGKTEQVAEQLDAVKGGSVGRTYDKLGYVRATVPTKSADSAISAAAKLSSVQGIDLRQEIVLDDPSPVSAKDAKSQATAAKTYPAPGKNTPAENPYNPSFETGAVDFVKQNPKADGRGITIGVLDSGVDLAHPALQKTSTGERKIVDWVTSTDPIVDGDGSWRPMTNSVAGPTFTYGGRTWTAPAGSYSVNTFRESVTAAGDAAGDVNRDGDTTDAWGVLYDAAAGTVTVDVNQNFDFTDDKPMKPYKDGYQIGYFGTDDPSTEVAERQPFVVEYRKDVPMDPFGGDWVGKKADFVNIGLISSEHGTHVAGITAAKGLFGGRMNGAAPGAQIVSSRACEFGPGCTNIALTEGMIDLVVNRGVDIVNMSIGGLPALNDGNNARAELYTRLIDTYGVQLVISAGNSGPGANTIGDPGLADKVISVGASISKETWASNYGSQVTKDYQLFNFSSRGPREDGGFTPTLVAPGAAVNTAQTWLPGVIAPEAGYTLPAGYQMLNGTSMASPQATGSAALLLSAAKQKGVDLPPAKLRTALTSTADHISGVQAYAEGAGLMNIVDAWKSVKAGATAHEYAVKAPVDTAIDFALKTPGFGTGVYDREGGLKVGQKKTYEVTITRTSGADKAIRHELHLENNRDDTFRIVGDDVVSLPLNKPVTVKIAAKPENSGISSAILEVDDPKTVGIDRQVLNTVVVSTPLKYAHSASGTVQRNSFKSYFITVPEGAKTLEVAISGLKDKSQTRFIANHPYGLAVENTSSLTCYNNFQDGGGCKPDVRSYANPQPGVWEIEVESRRTSPVLDNTYKLNFAVYGASFDPEVVTVPEAKVGTPTAASWKVTNALAPVDGKLAGGPLGSAKTDRPTIATGVTQTTTVEVPAGAESLDVAIGNTADTGADLDLYVRDAAGTEVASSADGDSEEAVSVPKPAAGTYTIEVVGYAVPSGSTAYDYRDVFFSSALGEVKVADTAVKLGTGQSTTVSGDVVAAAAAPAGREFFGQVQLVNARGTAAGTGSVRIEKVTP